MSLSDYYITGEEIDCARKDFKQNLLASKSATMEQSVQTAIDPYQG